MGGGGVKGKKDQEITYTSVFKDTRTSGRVEIWIPVWSPTTTGTTWDNRHSSLTSSLMKNRSSSLFRSSSKTIVSKSLSYSWTVPSWSESKSSYSSIVYEETDTGMSPQTWHHPYLSRVPLWNAHLSDTNSVPIYRTSLNTKMITFETHSWTIFGQNEESPWKK